MQKEDGENR